MMLLRLALGLGAVLVMFGASFGAGVPKRAPVRVRFHRR